MWSITIYCTRSFKKETIYNGIRCIQFWGSDVCSINWQQPFNNLAHDEYLAMNICKGARPGFSNNTPKFYIELAFKCMDANPDKRPTVEEVFSIIQKWNYDFDNLRKEFDKMDEIKFDPSTITAVIHPNAIYTSRLLNFTNLPQPVNSNKVTIIGNNNGNY